MGVTRIDTPAAAAALAERLNALHRSRPLVLTSTSAATNEPWIDVEEIDSELGELADVYLVETGAPSWALAERIPPRTEAYGGAGRVYPIDNSWVRDLRRSPLHFAFDADSGRRATRALIADALRFANAAGLLARPASPQTREASGTVVGIPTPDRAMVKLDDRTWATITQELTVPDVPVADVLCEGMQVRGTFDPASRRLDISASVRPARDALAPYQAGATVLARVEKVRARSARLALYPGVEAWVRGDDVTSNELDDFRTLMTEGEVVVAHLVARSPGWRLLLADVDDDEEPLEAPTVIEGGLPWLRAPTIEEPITLPEPSTEEMAAQLETSAPPEPSLTVPAAGKAVQGLGLKVTELQRQLSHAQSQLAALQRERDMLAGQLTRAHSDADQLRRQAKQLRTEVRRRSRRPSEEALAGLFTDREEQLRYEIRHQWAIRIPAADKARLPLRDYLVGPDFIASMSRLEGVSRSKIVDVVVEVLTGLAKDIDGRRLHPLRVSEAGDAPPVIRSSDGAQAWRVNLQTNTPSARRLHYWQRNDGSVELAKVAVHDDFTI
jgi:hypothetical protein